LSSILRALKKIERDALESPGIQSGPGMPSVDRVREKPFVYKSMLAVVVVIFLFIGGVLFIHKQPPSKPDVYLPAHDAPAVNMSRQPDPAYHQAQSEPVDKTNVAPVVDEKINKVKVPESKLPIQFSHEADQTEVAGGNDAPAAVKAFQDMKKIPDEIEPGKIKDSADIIQNSQSWSGVDEIDQNAGLDLQAISWAADAQKRLAVINGSLCRENESINGYVVKQINPDDVIVSKGSVTGKLVLKIR
jgi:hypothetical protein